jgi:uncharacterized membrane protein
MSNPQPAGAMTLISGTFDDEDSSRQAFDRLAKLHSIALMSLTGLVWIAVADDGHLEMTTTPHDPAAPESEASASAFAQILGSLLTTPILGAKVGGTVAAVVDRISESDDTPERGLRKKVASILKPGKWSVVGYASDVAVEATQQELGELGEQLAFWPVDESAQNQLARDAGIDPK